MTTGAKSAANATPRRNADARNTSGSLPRDEVSPARREPLNQSGTSSASTRSTQSRAAKAGAISTATSASEAIPKPIKRSVAVDRDAAAFLNEHADDAATTDENSFAAHAVAEDSLDEEDADEAELGEGARHEYSRNAGGGERLQKLIARGGVSSRRAAEELISQGRVLVNGHVVTELGARADIAVDRINVDGRPLRISSGPATVLLMHKPAGVVTTRLDPEGRTTITHLLPEKYRHLHPIGRLDFDTSGVLLLTDDGSLTQLLTHPSHGVEKVYWARVRGQISVATLKQLEAGIFLEDGKTAPCRARVRAQTERNALIQLTLREGRNRQVRRMLEFVGHPTRALRRVKFANLALEGLLPGEHRVLLPGEVHALRKAAEAKPKTLARRAAPGSRRSDSKIALSASIGKTAPKVDAKPKVDATPARSSAPRLNAPHSSTVPSSRARQDNLSRPQAPPRTAARASENVTNNRHPVAHRIEETWQQAPRSTDGARSSNAARSAQANRASGKTQATPSSRAARPTSIASATQARQPQARQALSHPAQARAAQTRAEQDQQVQPRQAPTRESAARQPKPRQRQQQWGQKTRKRA